MWDRHGNALTKRAPLGALFDQALQQFEVIFTNPPFGGKEGKEGEDDAILDNASRLANLSADGLEQEENVVKPFPSDARQLP